MRRSLTLGTWCFDFVFPTWPRAWPLALTLFPLTPAVGQPSFQGLGFFPRGIQSRAQAISGDGQVVVGYADGREFEYNYTGAFRWTTDAGLIALGFEVGGYENYATAVSADGSVIVGMGSGAYMTGYRWTEELGMRALAAPSEGSDVYVGACSADGRFVVGSSWWQDDGLIRWSSEGGVINLGLLPGDLHGSASAVSADGGVIVGGSYDGQHLEAVIWTPDVGLRPFPGLADDVIVSDATDVTADGRVVVGYFSAGGVGQSFRWTAASGLAPLGVPPGYGHGWARAVSADGRVIAGVAAFPGVEETFIWTAARGFRRLQEVLLEAGIEQVAGWQLFEPMGISDDGATIVGSGYNPEGLIEAWIARVPRDCAVDFDGDGLMSIFDLLGFQNAFAAMEPEGDCDGDGGFTVLDFLCFVNGFNAGC
jgi:probable HAF family extracellular repeat protein